MKVLLITIAIGEEYLLQYKDLFYESQQNYALKYGYDFKVITDFLDKNIQHKNTVSFNKILVCEQEFSKDYDFIVFIDADILQGSSGGMVIGTDGLIYGSIMGVTGQHADLGIGERSICPSNKIKALLQSVVK